MSGRWHKKLFYGLYPLNLHQGSTMKWSRKYNTFRLSPAFYNIQKLNHWSKTDINETAPNVGEMRKGESSMIQYISKVLCKPIVLKGISTPHFKIIPPSPHFLKSPIPPPYWQTNHPKFSFSNKNVTGIKFNKYYPCKTTT